MSSVPSSVLSPPPQTPTKTTTIRPTGQVTEILSRHVHLSQHDLLQVKFTNSLVFRYILLNRNRIIATKNRSVRAKTLKTPYARKFFICLFQSFIIPASLPIFYYQFIDDTSIPSIVFPDLSRDCLTTFLARELDGLPSKDVLDFWNFHSRYYSVEPP